MTRLAYVDESQRQGRYLLAAMLVEHQAVSQVRKDLRAAAPPRGVGRRHFTREKDPERRKLLAIFRELPGVEVTVYVVDAGFGPPVVQRAIALEHLVPRLIDAGVEQIVLDHLDHADALRDRQVLRKLTKGHEVNYRHEPPHSSEPMLWVPDGAAWCAGRPEMRALLNGWATIITI